MNTHGIDESIWKQILDTCFRFPGVSKVILYGSRARGDYKLSSDIDIAIDAPLMTSREFAEVWNAIDDLPIIYTFDVVHLQALTSEQLLSAIHKEGVGFSRPSK